MRKAWSAAAGLAVVMGVLTAAPANADWLYGGTYRNTETGNRVGVVFRRGSKEIDYCMKKTLPSGYVNRGHIGYVRRAADRNPLLYRNVAAYNWTIEWQPSGKRFVHIKKGRRTVWEWASPNIPRWAQDWCG